MSKITEYLELVASDKKHKNNNVVYVLDHETYKTPDGKVITTHSRPMKPAPDGKFDSDKYGWSDVLCKWVKLEDIDKPCVIEM